jgi:hypothetical protein
MIDQNYLNNYFANHWGHKGVPVSVITGIELANKVNNNEWVLDVGCGRNLFKGKIKNLVGIDPAFDEADVKTTIEEYKTEQMFDVAFCLGSINFGSIEDIRRQIVCVIDYLKPRSRIYWRCNPGLQDHGNEECKNIEFFPWSEEWHMILSKEYGFELTEFAHDGNRIYAVWEKA